MGPSSAVASSSVAVRRQIITTTYGSGTPPYNFFESTKHDSIVLVPYRAADAGNHTGADLGKKKSFRRLLSLICRKDSISASRVEQAVAPRCFFIISEKDGESPWEPVVAKGEYVRTPFCGG